MPNRCRPGFRALTCVIAAALFWPAPAKAVILYATGDATANTSNPTGDLASAGWQWEGKFGNFIATAIAPHFIITAKHIGGASQFLYRGVTYTVTASYSDPQSDLAIFQVAQTLPAYADLYSRNDEVGQRLFVVGRGTQRGLNRIVNGNLVGWNWGSSDMVERWGENVVASITGNGGLLRALFDQNGLTNEATLSGGDSGGGLFINDGGTWKLAGINYDVDSFASGPDGGGPYSAAVFDERGSYLPDGTLVTGATPVPSGFTVTRISSRIDWIVGIIAPRLANISARAVVGSGDDVAIAGFIVQGAMGEAKTIVVRGLGPSLAVNGVPVPGRLADPKLELHDSQGALVYENDNWADTQATQIQSSGLAPSDPREAAIWAILGVGSHTAILRDATGAGGVGLVEVYDVNGNTGARLGNLSARAFVGTNDQVLIGGLIVRAVGQSLVLRALGPSLTNQGVNGALQDPTLEFHDANGTLLAANDNWQSASNSSVLSATGLAPTDPREAAILSTAAPGNYTMLVRGANGTVGVALLEAYLLN
ncbi:MAG: trypsin-like peptidase domain-containing protein [Chthoniobacterales bacterium]